MPFSNVDTLLIIPELFLTAAGLGLLIYATFVRREHEPRIAILSIASLAVTGLLLGVSTRFAGTLPRSAFGGMLVVDRFGLYFQGLVILAAIITILFSLRFVGESPYPGGEYYGLILFTTVGMLFMAAGVPGPA